MVATCEWYTQTLAQCLCQADAKAFILSTHCPPVHVQFSIRYNNLLEISSIVITFHKLLLLTPTNCNSKIAAAFFHFKQHSTHALTATFS